MVQTQCWCPGEVGRVVVLVVYLSNLLKFRVFEFLAIFLYLLLGGHKPTIRSLHDGGTLTDYDDLSLS